MKQFTIDPLTNEEINSFQLVVEQSLCYWEKRLNQDSGDHVAAHSVSVFRTILQKLDGAQEVKV